MKKIALTSDTVVENEEKDADSEKEPVTSGCFTEKELAVYINMSCAFLRAARMNGALKRSASAPPFIRNGRTIRYLKSDVDTWLQSLQVVPTPVDDLLDK